LTSQTGTRASSSRSEVDTTRLHRRRREAWPVLGMVLLDGEVCISYSGTLVGSIGMPNYHCPTKPTRQLVIEWTAELSPQRQRQRRMTGHAD
jgi:hypothetical protein